MYVFWIYPTEHKMNDDGHIAMVWNEILPNGNYDFDNIIEVFRQHRDKLGVYCSDKGIAEIVNVNDIEAMNAYMDFGLVEFFGTGHWYGYEVIKWQNKKSHLRKNVATIAATHISSQVVNGSLHQTKFKSLS